MATKTTGWYCRHTASIVSSTNTTVTIKVECFWQNDGWYYQINYVSAWVYCNGQSIQVKNSGSINTTSNTQSVSCGSATFTIDKGTSAKSITCYAKITSNSSYVSGTKTSTSSSVSVPAKPSYTVSYNANGGSGAPSSQTKWYGTNLTLSSSKPTRTGYSFQGWGTSSTDTSVDYSAGATYSANASIALYAIWKANTYTVSYNANGGSGAPSSQTKTYGVNLTLSSTKPTRTNYNFKGWGTSASSTTVSYAAGASYTANAAITLYAIWEIAYIKPRISGFTALRCDVDGNTTDEGTYAKVDFSWETDKTVSSVKIEWKNPDDAEWSSVSVAASGTSGNVSQTIGGGEISTEVSYTIRITIEDTSGSNQYFATIGSAAYPIDVLAGGKGIAFGKVADTEEYADFNFKIKARKPVESIHTDMAFRQDNPNTGSAIAFGIGASGYNRGIYDYIQDKWLLYANQNNGATINADNAVLTIYGDENAYTKIYRNDGLAGGGIRIGKYDGLIYEDANDTYAKITFRYQTSAGSAWSYTTIADIMANNTLWSGAYHMNANQTVTLSSGISSQTNGIILIWSYYDNANVVVKNQDFNLVFVPKAFVSLYSGCGIWCTSAHCAISKYVYISNTTITGNSNNTLTTAINGANRTNNLNYVLRNVIGV